MLLIAVKNNKITCKELVLRMVYIRINRYNIRLEQLELILFIYYKLFNLSFTIISFI